MTGTVAMETSITVQLKILNNGCDNFNFKNFIIQFHLK